MGLPDSKLDETIVLPWGTEPYRAVIFYHEWNNTYHLGQVNYIQLMYGDEEMHM